MMVKLPCEKKDIIFRWTPPEGVRFGHPSGKTTVHQYLFVRAAGAPGGFLAYGLVDAPFEVGVGAQHAVPVEIWRPHPDLRVAMSFFLNKQDAVLLHQIEIQKAYLNSSKLAEIENIKIIKYLREKEVELEEIKWRRWGSRFRRAGAFAGRMFLRRKIEGGK